MAADERLKCFEYGATAQAELFFADGILESMEQHATRSPESLILPGGTSYVAQNEEILRIQRDALSYYFDRAEKALGGAIDCGVTPDVVKAFRGTLGKVNREITEGNYSLARSNLNQLRARLRHPDQWF